LLLIALLAYNEFHFETVVAEQHWQIDICAIYHRKLLKSTRYQYCVK